MVGQWLLSIIGIVEFFLLLVIHFPSTWSDTYSTQNQFSLYDKTSLTKGDSVVVYVHATTSITNDTGIANERAVFFPLVDGFSQLNIPSSAEVFRNNTEVYVYLNVSGGIISSPRFYKDEATPNYFVGYFTAVIVLNEGNITQIYWVDDNCTECEDWECVNQTNCGISYNDTNNCQPSKNATATNTDGQLCNIVIYLAWLELIRLQLQ